MLSSMIIRTWRSIPYKQQTSFHRPYRRVISSSLNSDNMSEHHMSNPIPPQEWGTFNGKIPVLQEVTKIYSDSDVAYGEKPRTSVLMELTDRVGILHDVLRYFWKYDVNICRIESRPAKGRGRFKRFDFFVDFEGSLEEEHIRYGCRCCLGCDLCLVVTL
jgi:hypothetical protein